MLKPLITLVDEEQYLHGSKLSSHRLLASHKGKKVKLYNGSIILSSFATSH